MENIKISIIFTTLLGAIPAIGILSPKNDIGTKIELGFFLILICLFGSLIFYSGFKQIKRKKNAIKNGIEVYGMVTESKNGYIKFLAYHPQFKRYEFFSEETPKGAECIKDDFIKVKIINKDVCVLKKEDRNKVNEGVVNKFYEALENISDYDTIEERNIGHLFEENRTTRCPQCGAVINFEKLKCEYCGAELKKEENNNV